MRLITLILCLVALPALSDWYIEPQLGSHIGDTEQLEGGQMPFWFESGYSVPVGLFDVDLGGGHRSNADYNGNETDYEYGFIEGQLNAGRFYVRGGVNHVLQGDLNDESLLVLEGGIQQGSIKFSAYYETGTRLVVQGLKFSYRFGGE